MERAHDLMTRAQALFIQGEVGRARQLLASGVDLAPQVPALVVALADVFATEGNVNAACDLLTQVARLHPTNHEASDRRAEILAEASERTLAQQAAQRAFTAAAL
jgi:thioredoxin-like negative regulator of GroEL